MSRRPSSCDAPLGPGVSESPHDKPRPVDFAIPPAAARGGDEGLIASELSARRTGLSFQRTRMSADRTLMSVIRTSLALIGFGFTIFQFFQHLQEKHFLSGGTHAARNFGAALVWLGIGMLIIGIVYHVQFMLGLRGERSELAQEGLVHAQSRFPVSFTLLVAIALFFVGVAAIVSLIFNIGPFG